MALVLASRTWRAGLVLVLGLDSEGLGLGLAQSLSLFTVYGNVVQKEIGAVSV